MFHMYSVLYPVIHTTLPRMQIVQNHDMDKPCVSLLPDLTRLGTEYERVVGVAKPRSHLPEEKTGSAPVRVSRLFQGQGLVSCSDGDRP